MKAEVEALLATAWTRETFATYADVLQMAGDPRGDWIALELAMVRDGVTPAILETRDEIHRRFGIVALAGSDFSFGFADNLRPPPGDRDAILVQLRAALEGPLGSYVRRIELRGGPEHLSNLVRLLAAAERPWLYELALDAGNRFQPPAIPRDLLQLAIDRCPNLASIEIWSVSAEAMFGGLDHPRIAVTVAEPNISPVAIRFAIPDRGHEDIQLAWLERLHATTVTDETREAWAELRWRILCAESDRRARGAQPFSAALLAQIVGAIDPRSHGGNWSALARKLAGVSEVIISF